MDQVDVLYHHVLLLILVQKARMLMDVGNAVTKRLVLRNKQRSEKFSLLFIFGFEPLKNEELFN
ncbi:hypothetical protein EG348_11560 [Chryseobacterium sp. G0201]|nr:hypothetical protein EG348_11560 [Chryseobacterium sp. G0201]